MVGGVNYCLTIHVGGVSFNIPVVMYEGLLQGCTIVCGYISEKSSNGLLQSRRYACRMLRVWSGLKQVVIVTMATCCCHDATNAPSLRNLTRDLRTTSAVDYSLHSNIVWIYIYIIDLKLCGIKSMHVFAPCMCVLIYVRMYTVYIYSCTCSLLIYIPACMYIRIYSHRYVCTYIYSYVYIYICMHMYACVKAYTKTALCGVH